MRRVRRADARPDRPSSTTECARLFPELYTGGVAPHGVDVYEYSASNPNTKKFPAYYDKSIFMGEFGQDTMREIKLDSQNRVFKINHTLDCGAANIATRRSCSSATTRRTCSSGTTVRCTC